MRENGQRSRYIYNLMVAKREAKTDGGDKIYTERNITEEEGRLSDLRLTRFSREENKKRSRCINRQLHKGK